MIVGTPDTNRIRYQQMPLSDVQLRNLKAEAKPYRRADGGGLFVEVRPNGSRLWRLAYRFDGKQKLMALGSYPETSLARAREKRQEAKSQLQDGVDPMAQVRADREARQAETEHSFAAIAEELLAKVAREGLAPSTLQKKQWLLDMANADLGSLPISQISAADVLRCLKKVDDVGNYETAKRLRTAIGQVFRYAIATARAENDPTYALRGALTSPKVKHRAAITDRAGFAALIRAIWSYDGAVETQAALKLMALIYPRPGELRMAHWAEFDLEKAIWTIPAERAKMRREHIKPLPGMTVEILQHLQSFSDGNSLVFPSQVSRARPISENTMNSALRRLGYGKADHTPHGFRASASSLLNESGKWNADAIEAELAHVGSDQVRRAYHRTQYWDERVRMADWWAGEIVVRLGGE